MCKWSLLQSEVSQQSILSLNMRLYAQSLYVSPQNSLILQTFFANFVNWQTCRTNRKQNTCWQKLSRARQTCMLHQSNSIRVMFTWTCSVPRIFTPTSALKIFGGRVMSFVLYTDLQSFSWHQLSKKWWRLMNWDRLAIFIGWHTLILTGFLTSAIIRNSTIIDIPLTPAKLTGFVFVLIAC